MRTLLIFNENVVNIIEAESIPQDNFGYDVAVFSETGNIGDGYVNGLLVAADPVILESLPEPEPLAPSEISNIQAYAAIKHFGLLPTVMTYMNSLPADDLIRITWEKATVFKRTSPTLLLLAEELELTSEQVDDMFRYGNSIHV